MSTFLVRDEHGPRFRELELNIELHALANTLYIAAGHACVQDRTDGLVTDLMMRRALPAWGGRRTRRVVDALVRIGAWREAGKGRYQFAHWDLEQQSAAQEEARREKWAADKRRQRAAHLEQSGVRRIPGSKQAFDPPSKAEFQVSEEDLFGRNETENINGFAETTPNVHQDVHPGVHHDPSPSPAAAPCGTRDASPAEKPATSAGTPPAKKLKPPKKATESSAHKQLVATLYAEAFLARYASPASPPNWALVQAIVSWAQQTPDPEAAIRASLAGYFDSWVGQRMKHPLHLWAKSPASFHAEHSEKNAGELEEDPFYRIDPKDGLSPFDRQFIVRRTA